MKWISIPKEFHSKKYFKKMIEDENNFQAIDRKKSCYGSACVPVLLVLALILILTLLHYNQPKIVDNFQCEQNCKINIVESIPEGLNFSENSPKFMRTFEAWMKLIDISNETLDIGSFYWTLRGEDFYNHTTAAEGELVFKKIMIKGITNKVRIKIAQSAPTDNEPNKDTEILVRENAAQVVSVDFPRLLGGGVLHTKLWIVDNKHIYLGSANMDWRSLTQVKELGVLITDCSCLARDVKKIFNAYWYLGQSNSNIPSKWPNEYSTKYNYKNPFEVIFNNHAKAFAFFSSSPQPLVAEGRETDLDAIIKIISSANSYVNIAVMDYMPLLIYTDQPKYWPYIDDAIRSAAINKKISIKMLISWWPHSNPSEDYFLRSLKSLALALAGVDIQIRRFIVPSDDDQSKIPFARVNHNKYMVTDNTAYIGTSNWEGDYFKDTAGIGLVFRESVSNLSGGMRNDLLSIFTRDWESPYSVEFD